MCAKKALSRMKLYKVYQSVAKKINSARNDHTQKNLRIRQYANVELLPR